MISVAIVGLGWWGATLTGLAQSSGKMRVVRAIDLRAEAAPWAAERGIPFSQRFDDALADPAVDAVVLCTPHSQHRDQVLAAAAAKKHVFCEKPLALSRREAVECVRACRDAGLVLGIGHERRFEPPILDLRRKLAEGELGVPLQIEANFSQDKFLDLPADNWRLSGKDAPAGPMTATGIHLLDLAVSFLGPARSAAANVARLGSRLSNGDTLGALVGFESGANALIGAMLATPFFGRFALYGSKGWCEIVDKAHPEASQGWIVTTCLRGAARISADYPPASAVLANLEAFADAVAGRAAYPVTDAELIGTIAALEMILRSAGSGGSLQVVDT